MSVTATARLYIALHSIYTVPQTLHELLERSTWHSAQHAWQLIDLLERYRIDPDGPLVEEDLAGLALPKGVLE